MTLLLVLIHVFEWEQYPLSIEGLHKGVILFSDIDMLTHEYHMARREAFSRWLSSTASRKIKKEINDAKLRVRLRLHDINKKPYIIETMHSYTLPM